MADFDPDAYLASKTAVAASPAFDPDAYLKEKGAPVDGKKPWYRTAIEGVARAGPSQAGPVPIPQTVEEANANAKGATKGLALGSRVGSSALASEGGPTGFVIGGGGELVAQALEGDIRPGEILKQATISSVPLGSTKGAYQVAKNAGKMALAGGAGEEARSLIDEGKLSDNAVSSAAIPAAITVAAPLLSKTAEGVRRIAGKEAPVVGMNATKSATLTAAQKAGYVVPPYEVNPSGLNKTLGGIAGKAATGQETALANQKVTNELAAKGLGLPKETEITPAVLKDVRKEAGQAYQDVADLSKDKNAIQAVALVNPTAANHISDAAITLQALKQARSDAAGHYAHYARSADPSVLKSAQAAEDTANALEDSLSEAAKYSGKPELADALAAARTRIAKSYDVEKAMNLGDANISAPVLGRALDKGRPLSGELETVAKFQQAFPKSAVEGASVPAPGVSKISAGLGGILGTAIGVGTHNTVAGVLAGMAPEAASRATRKFLLSGVGQRLLNAPIGSSPEVDALVTKILAEQTAYNEESKGKKVLAETR